MESKELIESGSLELYVLNALLPEEMAQIDELRIKHPDVDEEIHRIEKTMMDYAEVHAEKPRPELKEEIAKRIEFGVELDLHMENIKTVFVHLKPLIKVAGAIAASLIIILAVSVAYLTISNHSLKKAISQMAGNESDHLRQINLLSEENDLLRNQVAIENNPGNLPVILTGLSQYESARAIIYWNTETGNIYINSFGLPGLNPEEQFQVWVINQGTPLSVGLLEPNKTFSSLSSAENVSEFAVTIEPLGGSAQPTLQKMVVHGSI